MRVLLIKPSSGALEFGLAPFFQTEPLGVEYVAAALVSRGHSVSVADLRFDRRGIPRLLRHEAPDLVGLSCVHVLEADVTARLAAEIKALRPGVTIVVGGHAASMYPRALSGSTGVDAIVVGEGEATMPAVCEAIGRGRDLGDVPGLLLPDSSRTFGPTGPPPELLDLSRVAIPDRTTVAAYQRHYCCLNYMPVWTIETARGCDHRCKFCSVWQFHQRSVRYHANSAVLADFRAAGPNIFVVDDTFWSNEAHSRTLADDLRAGGVHKNWILVQSRLDTVVQHPELLERWKPLARRFDIFFGFEAPTTSGLDALHKDSEVGNTIEAVAIARRLGFGVTGNFIIDPNYGEEDFRILWDFLAKHQLTRVGFTVLTPLPGTRYFEQMRETIQVQDWERFDLHHLLWQPRLPVRRFFELYCETWRRTVLNASGEKKWWHWLSEVKIRDIPRFARILARTQKLMDPDAYLAETDLRDVSPACEDTVAAS
jgi:hopanoid C-3 methylase